MLAMVVNDNACLLTKRGVLESIASKLAPTGGGLRGIIVYRSYSRWIPRVASLLLCLLFWQLAASHHWNLGLVTFANVPTPVAVIEAALGLGDSGKLAQHLGSSLGPVSYTHLTLPTNREV